MKRKALIVLSLVVAMLSLSNVRVSATPVQVPLQVGYIDPSYEQDEPQRGPILVPEVSIDGYALLFGTNCDGCTLRIVNEDGDVEFSTIIPTGASILYLPSTLSGDYEIQFIQGQWCFYGWIEL